MNIRSISGAEMCNSVFVPREYIKPGWYFLPCPVIADVWIDGVHVQRVIPAGWYELISTSGRDAVQLSTVGRQLPGQTSRFIVNRSEVEGRQYFKNRVDIR